jgi:high-affinity Fe2+/Pb2+ permease
VDFDQNPSSESREAEALRIFGVFFGLLAAPVLIGALWSLDRPHAAVVSVAAGGMLLTVAAVMFAVGTRLKRNRERADGP